MASSSSIDAYTYSYESYGPDPIPAPLSPAPPSPPSHPELHIETDMPDSSAPEHTPTPWWQESTKDSAALFDPANEPGDSASAIRAGSKTKTNLTWRNVVFKIPPGEVEGGESGRDEERGGKGKKKEGVVGDEEEGRRGKTILHGISGSVAAGETLAILGPSGSGKTSLLNILAGRVKANVTGEVAVSGVPLTQIARHAIGYVYQDDVLFSELTVLETLQFAAELRLPSDLSKEQRAERVDALMDDLRIAGCADTRIGNQFKKGVSGGERKRTAVAVELLSNPSVLLLDEPCSGLDFSTSLILLKLLRRLAVVRTQAVVLTIHQPSTQLWERFDKVLVLDGGRTAYFGRADGMVAAFSTIGIEFPHYYNPADFVLEVVTHATDAVRKSVHVMGAGSVDMELISSRLPEGGGGAMDAAATAALTETTYQASWWRQFVLLARRAFVQNRGDILSQITIVQTLVLAVVCGIIWWQVERTVDRIHDLVGLLFFGCIFWSFMPLFQSIQAFPAERSTVTRERAAGMYSLSAYTLAKTVAESPVQLVLPTMWGTIAYWMAGVSDSPVKFLVFLCILNIQVLGVQSVGLAFGAAFSNVAKALTTASTMLLSTLLAGGFYVKSDNLPEWFAPFQWLALLKYSWEAHVMIALDGDVFECKDPGQPNDFGVCPVTRDDIVRFYSFDLDPWVNILILIAFAVVMRTLAFVVLKLRGV